MSSLPVDLNLGYDPTTVERGPLIRPKTLASPPPTATVNPKFLPPPQAQGTMQHEGSPGTCAAWATTYGLATFTAADAMGQSPSTPALQASPAHIYIEVMKSYGVSTCQGSQISSYLNILSQGGTPNWQRRRTLRTASSCGLPTIRTRPSTRISRSPDGRSSRPPISRASRPSSPQGEPFATARP